MSREDFEGIAENAKRIHAERVAKTPDRIAYAKNMLDKNGIRYALKSAENGHMHVWDSSGALWQFWCSTGKILGREDRGIHRLVKLILRVEAKKK